MQTNPQKNSMKDLQFPLYSIKLNELFFLKNKMKDTFITYFDEAHPEVSKGEIESDDEIKALVLQSLQKIDFSGALLREVEDYLSKIENNPKYTYKTQGAGELYSYLLEEFTEEIIEFYWIRSYAIRTINDLKTHTEEWIALVHITEVVYDEYHRSVLEGEVVTFLQADAFMKYLIEQKFNCYHQVLEIFDITPDSKYYLELTEYLDDEIMIEIAELGNALDKIKGEVL